MLWMMEMVVASLHPPGGGGWRTLKTYLIFVGSSNGVCMRNIFERLGNFITFGNNLILKKPLTSLVNENLVSDLTYL